MTCSAMADRGLYIAAFQLPRRCRLRVGALGRFPFAAGVYLYVGSAQRNRKARVDRHGRKDKPLRWHIDYLSAKARMLGAVLVAGSRRQECRLARTLAASLPRAVPRFGASDCGCGGHLFYAGPTPGGAGLARLLDMPGCDRRSIERLLGGSVWRPKPPGETVT